MAFLQIIPAMYDKIKQDLCVLGDVGGDIWRATANQYKVGGGVI